MADELAITIVLPANPNSRKSEAAAPGADGRVRAAQLLPFAMMIRMNAILLGLLGMRAACRCLPAACNAHERTHAVAAAPCDQQVNEEAAGGGGEAHNLPGRVRKARQDRIGSAGTCQRCRHDGVQSRGRQAGTHTDP